MSVKGCVVTAVIGTFAAVLVSSHAQNTGSAPQLGGVVSTSGTSTERFPLYERNAFANVTEPRLGTPGAVQSVGAPSGGFEHQSSTQAVPLPFFLPAYGTAAAPAPVHFLPVPVQQAAKH